MENGKHPVYEFGGFQLDPLRHTLFRQGQPVALTPKLFETLVLLVENRDRVLPKDEMMQTLWAETFVEEGNLSQNIFLLRKTLGDDRNGHSFIHTIPRRGYRFVAPVTEIETESIIALTRGRDWEYWKKNSPFRSLTVFEEEDAWLFFGREAETAELLNRVKHSAVVPLVGNSGSGKSSLLRAGLIPALREGCPLPTNGSNGTQGNDHWRIVVFRPSATPFDYLAEVLPGQLAPELSVTEQAEFIADCRAKLPAGGDSLRSAISALVSANNLAEAGDTRVLLVVDQFEELFTLTHNPALRDRYIDSLLAAARLDGAVPVHLVLSLRADFFGHCLDHRELRTCLESTLLTLGSMQPEQMRQTIERRLQLAGGRAEPGLIDSLLEDVGVEPGNLALLEHALGQLWEQCRGPGCTFTNSVYIQIGRLRGALGRHADAVLQSLNEEQKHLTKKIFLELVHLGEGAQDTGRRVRKSDLLHSDEPARVEQLLTRLASSRLIAMGREGEETFVGVSHEALIREWPALRQWLAENREDMTLERRLGQAAGEWQTFKRDAGALLQGARLVQAEDWLARHEKAKELLREYLQVSIQARAKAAQKEREAHRRELKHFRWFSCTVSILLLAALGSAWLAYRQRVLEKSRAMAAQAEEMATRDHGRSVALAISSWRTAKTDEAHLALASAFPEPLLTLRQSGPVDQVACSPDGNRILSVSREDIQLWDRQGRLLGILEHGSPVGGAAFSRDGRVLVSTGQDHIRIWDGTGTRLLESLPNHTARLDTVALSPDGKLIFTGGADKTARIWDWERKRLVATLEGHTGALVEAEFSPDGKRIITASRDKTAREWESGTGQLIANLRGHQDEVLNATFSPDGRLILTAGADNTARLWSSADGRLLRVLQHKGIVTRARFSPDGRLVATGSFDNAARIWNVDDGRLMATLTQGGPIVDVSFSPDGQHLATASFDQTARIWNSHDGRLLALLRGHTGPVSTVFFLPSGDQVVTGSADKTVRAWNLSAAVTVDILRHEGMVTGAEFAPDGQTFVTSGEPVAHLWNSSDDRLRAVLPGHSDRIVQTAFSIRGDRLLTGSQDGTLRVWSIPDGRFLIAIRGQANIAMTGSFSPDGRHIVTTNLDQTARIWRTDDGALLAVLQEHRGRVLVARFSPDGERILTGSDNGTLRVWSATDGHILLTLRGHAGSIHNAIFSPDGQWILSAGEDKAARLWNAADGRLLATFQGHTAPVYGALFSPDGSQILTFGGDGVARLWDSSHAHLLASLAGHTGPIFRAQFSPDGKHILTASADNTARTWNSNDGNLEHVLQGHTWQVVRAAFFPEGHKLITASLDQTARIWEIVTLDDIERILSQ